MSRYFAASEPRLNSCCDGRRPADSREEIRQRLDLYRSTRAQTLTLVERLSQAQMDYTPAPGKWSPGEVLDHLLLGERLNLGHIHDLIEMKRRGERPVLRLSLRDLDISIGYLPKTLLQFFEVPLTVMNMFVPGSFRDALTRYRLIPAQNSALTTPRHGRGAEELRNDLICSLQETEALLDAHSDLDYREMVIQHPLLGSNTIPELIRFLAFHEQRHQSQIKETMSGARFPQPLPDSRVEVGR